MLETSSLARDQQLSFRRLRNKDGPCRRCAPWRAATAVEPVEALVRDGPGTQRSRSVRRSSAEPRAAGASPGGPGDPPVPNFVLVTDLTNRRES